MKKILPILILISLTFLVGGSTSAAVLPGMVERAPEVDPLVTIERIGNLVFTFLLVLAGVVLIIAGILFVTAAGSETRITQARNMFMYALLGIILALIAKGLVTLIRGYLGGPAIPGV